MGRKGRREGERGRREGGRGRRGGGREGERERYHEGCTCTVKVLY